MGAYWQAHAAGSSWECPPPGGLLHCPSCTTSYLTCTLFILLRLWTDHELYRVQVWNVTSDLHCTSKHKKCKNSSITISFSRWVPPPPHKLLHMGHNVVKNILRRGSHFTKICEKIHTFYFSQALIPRIIMHIQHPLSNTERFSTKEKWNDVSK